MAARRWPGTGLAALTADLPALRPAELAAALRAAERRAQAAAAFVPDAAGVGTTLYAVPPGGEFLPAVRRGVPGHGTRRPAPPKSIST